jgi:hypothetical protein
LFEVHLAGTFDPTNFRGIDDGPGKSSRGFSD